MRKIAFLLLSILFYSMGYANANNSADRPIVADQTCPAPDKFFYVNEPGAQGGWKLTDDEASRWDIRHDLSNTSSADPIVIGLTQALWYRDPGDDRSTGPYTCKYIAKLTPSRQTRITLTSKMRDLNRPGPNDGDWREFPRIPINMGCPTEIHRNEIRDVTKCPIKYPR